MTPLASVYTLVIFWFNYARKKEVTPPGDVEKGGTIGGNSEPA
jgi:hypothetical protein